MRRSLLAVLFVAALSPVSPMASAQDSAARAQLAVDVASGADTLGCDSAHALATGSGDLARGRSHDQPVRLTAGQCIVAVARGAGIDNLDVAVVRGRTVVGRDTNTGPSASVEYCAGAAGETLAVRVTAFRGQGAYALGVYERRAQAQGTGTQAQAPGTGDTRPILERLDALVHAQTGYAAAGVAAREQLTEGQAVERTVNIVPGRCYRVLVAADPTVTDIDLVLLAPADGGEVQRDGTHRADPSLGVLRPLCPASPGVYRLRIALVHGSGALAWQALANQATAGAGGGATGAPVARFTIGGTDFLGGRIRTRAAALAARGTAANDVARATLQTNTPQDVTVEVTGGKCYLAVGAGAASVRELSLSVHDVLNNDLGHSTEHDAQPTARFCPQLAGRVRVTMRPIVGYGQVAVQVIELPQ